MNLSTLQVGFGETNFVSAERKYRNSRADREEKKRVKVSKGVALLVFVPGKSVTALILFDLAVKGLK